MTVTSDTPILRPVQGCGDDASSSRWAHCNGGGAVATLKCQGCGDDASSSRWAHCNGEGAVATLKCDGLEAEP